MPDCKSCKESRQSVEPVPYIVHESAMARQERVNKRWFLAWLITFVLFIASWAGFLWYESQWEVVETEITQENDGGYNNYIGNDGDIYNGETDG